MTFFTDFDEAKAHGLNDAEAYQYAISEGDGLCYHPRAAIELLGHHPHCSVCGLLDAVTGTRPMKVATHREHQLRISLAMLIAVGQVEDDL